MTTALRPDRTPTRRRPRVNVVGLTAVLVAVVAACAEETPPEPSAGEYRLAAESICTATTVELDELAAPTDDAGVAAFATAVSAALGDEADQMRDLAVPGELDDDHRAFVRNTDEQSAGWSDLAATPTTGEEFGELAREIGELTLGRNDLSAEMGLDACVRTPTGPS